MSTLSDNSGVDKSRDQIPIGTGKHNLSRRLSDPLNLQLLADSLGVSKTRLSNIFKCRLGMTVAGFLRQEPMRTAQRLLVQTSLGIQAIADEVGFSTAANFATAFRDFTGMSPTCFRRSAPLDSISKLQGALSWSSASD